MVKSWNIGIPCCDHDAFFRVQRWLGFALVCFFFHFPCKLILLFSFFLGDLGEKFCLPTRFFWSYLLYYLLGGCLCSLLHVGKL